MRTVSIKLSDALDCRLTALAKRRRTTRFEVMRQALEAFIDNTRRAEGPSPSGSLPLTSSALSPMPPPIWRRTRNTWPTTESDVIRIR
jgi:hypothetical protein